FLHVWGADRVVIRRIHALAALDPVLAQSVEARSARRRQELESILKRVSSRYGHPGFNRFAEAVEIIHMLTSFETFDQLANGSRKNGEVSDAIKRLALAAVVLHGAELESEKPRTPKNS